MSLKIKLKLSKRLVLKNYSIKKKINERYLMNIELSFLKALRIFLQDESTLPTGLLVANDADNSRYEFLVANLLYNYKCPSVCLLGTLRRKRDFISP